MRPLIRPSRLYYLLPLAVLVVGGLAGWRAFERRLDAVASRLTRVVVPGGTEVRFERPGHHTIFLEDRSVVGRTLFVGGGEPEGLLCSVTGPGAGAAVALRRSWLRLSYAREEGSGRSLYDFWVPAAGSYRVEARYPEGKPGPPRAIAVGEGLLGDLGAASAGPLLVAAAIVLAGVAGLLVVFALRERSKKQIYGRYGR